MCISWFAKLGSRARTHVRSMRSLAGNAPENADHGVKRCSGSLSGNAVETEYSSVQLRVEIFSCIADMRWWHLSANGHPDCMCIRCSKCPFCRAHLKLKINVSFHSKECSDQRRTSVHTPLLSYTNTFLLVIGTTHVADRHRFSSKVSKLFGSIACFGLP